MRYSYRMNKYILTITALLSVLFGMNSMANTEVSEYQSMNLKVSYKPNLADQGLVTVALTCMNNGQKVTQTDLPQGNNLATLYYSASLVQSACGNSAEPISIVLYYDTGTGIACDEGIMQDEPQDYNGKVMQLKFSGNTNQSVLECNFE